MKKIYVSHSTDFNFKKELYKPLKSITGTKFIFPHEKKINPMSTKNIIKSCNCVIADVSEPSHGVGIEIGWANSYGIPVVFIHKKDCRVSSSLKIISKKILHYGKVEDIIPKLEKMIRKIS